MTKKEILILSTPVLILILVMMLFIRVTNPKDYFENYIIPQEYSAIVLDKYRDKNHNYKRLTILHNNKEVTFSASDWTNLFEQANVGDSIVKLKGNHKLLLYRNNTLIYQSSYDTDQRGVLFRNRFKRREIN